MSGRSACALLVVAWTVAVAPLPAGAQAPADTALQARIESALAGAPDVPADSITVHVRGGVVTLTGSVVCDRCGGRSTPGGSATVQQSLGAIVRAIPGVRRVEFRLRYEPG